MCFIFNCVGSGYVYMSADTHGSQRCWTPGARVIDGYEPTEIGHWELNLEKNNRCKSNIPS